MIQVGNIITPSYQKQMSKSKNSYLTPRVSAFPVPKPVPSPNTVWIYWQIQNQVVQPRCLTPLSVGLILGRCVAIWSIRNCAIPLQGDLVAKGKNSIQSLYGYCLLKTMDSVVLVAGKLQENEFYIRFYNVFDTTSESLFATVPLCRYGHNKKNLSTYRKYNIEFHVSLFSDVIWPNRARSGSTPKNCRAWTPWYPPHMSMTWQILRFLPTISKLKTHISRKQSDHQNNQVLWCGIYFCPTKVDHATFITYTDGWCWHIYLMQKKLKEFNNINLVYNSWI